MLFFNNCVKSRISRHFVPKIPHSTKKTATTSRHLAVSAKKTATPESWGEAV